MKKLLLIPLMMLFSYIGVNAQGFGQFASGVFMVKDGAMLNTNVTGTISSVLDNAAPGTYTATCTNGIGCVSTASEPFTISEAVVNPPAVTATATSVCPGASTTLVAEGCDGEVTWSNGATGASIDAPAGTYTATCTIKLGAGRFAPSCVSAPSEIVINETPVQVAAT